MISVQSASRVYRGGSQEVHALKEVSLEVEKGDFAAIIGPSGCGKSTLMHCIGALDSLSSGDITIDGKSLAGLTDEQRTIIRRDSLGFVFQFFNLLPTLSVLENVLLPAMLAKGVTDDTESHARELLEEVGLSDRLDHRLHELSGGQMQRAAIARALVHQPDVLLADEPTGNLDSQASKQVMDLLLTISKKHETTVMLVTHSDEVASASDYRILMRDGEVVGRE